MSAGEPAGPPPLPIRRFTRRTTIVDTHPPGRACRWNGANTADLEHLTGVTTAPSLLDETTLIVDAWGTAQLCPHGSWVVVPARGPLRVLAPEKFARAYRIVIRREEAA